jgi:hypothetical protein
MDLKQRMVLIGTSPLKTTADLGRCIQDITSSTTLDNILSRELPFGSPKNLVHQTLHNMQRGSALAHFPGHARTVVDKILQEYVDIVKAGDSVEPSAILVRLAPHFPSPTASPAPHDELSAMFAPESHAPRASTDSLASTVLQFDPPASALLARQDPRKTSFPPRPKTTRPTDESDRREPDRREPDRREPDRRDSRPDPYEQSRSSGMTRPDSYRRAESPPPPSLKTLQKTISSLQSEVAQQCRRAKIADDAVRHSHSQRDRPLAYVAQEMPSSYDNDPESDTAHALGALTIDPDTWTRPSTFSRDGVYDSDF